MLKVEAIDLHYGAAQALRRVSVTAERGKITCVLGRNGVGKSSLLPAVTGQHPLSPGGIVLKATQDLTALRRSLAQGEGSAMCPRVARSFPS